ncbi:hypothetical protein Pelo_12315 [Pelomyxa schiedti]|nr:hypothetical protein Pelo_12315 [Pelomyxa schiedti]
MSTGGDLVVKFIGEDNFVCKCEEGDVGVAARTNFAPIKLLYGFVEGKADDWDRVFSSEITYKNASAGGGNNAVTVTIPQNARHIFVYCFDYYVWSESYSGLTRQLHSTSPSFIPAQSLSSCSGFVKLPIEWRHQHIHTPSEATITVGSWHVENAWLCCVFTGYSHDATETASWKDAFGNYGCQSTLQPILSGGYKRQGYMVDLWQLSPSSALLAPHIAFRVRYRVGESIYESPAFFTS